MLLVDECLHWNVWIILSIVFRNPDKLCSSIQAGEGRTTIIIAHRLSTVKNADIIAAVSEGHIEEIGTHDELLAKRGLYHTLLKLQVQYDNHDH